MLLPHESTVAHEQSFIMDPKMVSSRTRNANDLDNTATPGKVYLGIQNYYLSLLLSRFLSFAF